MCGEVAKSSKKVVLGPRFVRGGDTPDFGHTFTNYTQTMWPDMVEFRSASSEIRCRKRRRRNTGIICPPTTMSGGLKIKGVDFMKQ